MSMTGIVASAPGDMLRPGCVPAVNMRRPSDRPCCERNG
jgi:hypothetical protein